jgi:hypothetical protein
VLIDLTQKDPKRLVNDMVAARDAEGGVTIKWLRKIGNYYMLVPQHTSAAPPAANDRVGR